MYSDRRVFDWTSHEHFSRISCDFNPIHMDPIAARRTHAGTRIIHGVHSLIWVLDCFARSEFRETCAKALKVQFLRPIYIDDAVDLEISRPTLTTARARLLVAREEVVTVSIDCERSPRPSPIAYDPHRSSAVPPSHPYDRRLEEMRNLGGDLAFGPLMSEIASLYPLAVSHFGITRIAALVGSSCLVGMVAPGLHSMFSGLDVCLSDDFTPPEGRIQFMVLSITERFRLVRIGIRGQGLHGMLETISRLPPVKQPDMAVVKSHVQQGEFQNSKALIVGGSRGLGELTAKLIAAGGGKVIITYATGVEDAQAVASEITRAGSTCAVMKYDVQGDAFEQITALGSVPTHLYYFATPPIFRRKSALLDNGRFAEFSTFYLKGFFDVVQACIRLRPQGIKAFYPSSTAIDARSASMTEYTMAKAAGEILCADMGRFMPGVQVMMRRLPSLSTDQTSSVVQSNAVNPIHVILPIVREMQ